MKKCFLFLLATVFLLPLTALGADALADGQYTVEATLTGGSGRANITSPALLTARNGAFTATIVWSSPYYEYMRIDGVTYTPVQTEGNATFHIPVTLDADIPVVAQTVAMSQAHEIDYTLRFHAVTLRPVGESAKPPAVPLAIAGGVLLCAVWVVRDKRKAARKDAP